MKHILLTLLLTAIVGFGLQQPTPVQAQETFTVMTPGSIVAGTLEGDTTAQLFAFNAAVGDNITVDVAPDSSAFAPYVVLLGPAGGVIEAGAPPLNTQIPLSATYFVMVTAREAINELQQNRFEEPQGFQVAVNGNNPPPQADGRLAYFVTPLPYDAIFEEGYSSPQETLYYFSFNAERGDTLNIVVTSDDIDPVVYLFDPDGNRIATNDDADTLILPATTDAAIENFEVPETNAYHVFVTAADYFDIYDQNQLAEEDDEIEPLEFEGGDFEIVIQSQ